MDIILQICAPSKGSKLIAFYTIQSVISLLHFLIGKSCKFTQMEEWRRANGASASTFPCDVSPTNSGRPPPGYPPGYAEQQKQKQIAEKISQLELKLTMEQTQKLVLSQVVEKLMEENRGLREENGTLQRQVGRHEGIQIRVCARTFLFA